MCFCGSSGTGKSQLILSVLSTPIVLQGVFQLPFEHIVHIHRYWQPVYYVFSKILRKGVKVEFKCCIQSKNSIMNTLNNSSGASNEKNCVDDLILNELHAISEKHSNIGYPQKKKLLVFDDCGENILESEAVGIKTSLQFSINTISINRDVIRLPFIRHNAYRSHKITTHW